MNRRSPAWRASVLVAGGILPLLLMTWIPLNAREKISVHFYEKISATAQVTPISQDLTVTALANQKLSQEVTMTARENDKLTQEIGQLQHANERTVGVWLWNNALTAVLAAATSHKRHPAQANHYETPSSLSQALITVFKISFPLARAQLEKRNREYKDQNYRELDATGIELDNAYLVGTDLNGVWMPEASLVKADLTHIRLSHTNLARANLTEACLKVAELKHTNLRGAILTKADLTGADLAEADLTEAYLNGTNLTGANLSGSNPQAAKNLTGAIMRNVRGFSDPQQRQKCRDMYAIVEDIED